MATQIAGWPPSTTRGRNGSLAWGAQLLSSGPLIFASRTCANSVPICKHGSPSLEVVDIRTRRTLATSPRYSMLAVGDGHLWATNAQAAAPELVALSQRELTPTGELKLPGSSTTISATVAGTDVWAAAGSTLSEIGADPLHITRTFTAGGRVTDMASSPDGESLWDVVAVTDNSYEIQLRSAATGAVTGIWKPPAGTASLGGLTADNTGVWVAESGGMSTALARLQPAPLRLTIPGSEIRYNLRGQPITDLDAGNTLWTDISGQELTCDTDTEGTIRSKVLLATLPSTGALVATHSDLFVATPDGIDVVHPPAACSAPPTSSTTTTSAPPSTSVSVPARRSVRACTSRQVAITLAKQNPGNANQPSDYFAVRNVSTSPCEIDGYPFVRTETHPRHDVDIRHGSSYEITDPGPATFRLDPGRSAYFGIGWVQTLNPPCISVTALDLATRQMQPTTRVTTRMEACYLRNGAPILDVSAIRPAAAFKVGAPPP